MYIKLLMIFIMLFDSVAVFGRVNRNKKKKRSRVALSSRIVRGKGKQNNIKNGELKFEKPGSVFKKIEQDTRQISDNQTPPPKQNEPTQPQPEPPKNDIPTENDVVPPMRSPLPYVSPYVSKYPTQKAKPKQKEDPNKELKETITQLKSKIASSKNTCGAYTKTMADINKQLGLGVSLSSGIGLGLSAVATATGTGSYLMSKKQDKNFAKHGEIQNSVSSLKNLKTMDVNIDDNDLTKITATKKELATDKILALEKARAEAEELRIKLEEADGKAKDAELALNTEPDSTDTKEQDIKADADLQKKLKDAQDALANLQSQQDEPVKEPTQIAKTKEETDAEEADAKANKLKSEAEEAEEKLIELQGKQSTDDEIKNKTLATLLDEQKAAQEEYDKHKNQKHNNKDKKYVHECKRIQNFIVSNSPNSNPTYNEIERLEPVKVDRIKWGTMFGLQNNTLQWRNIVSHLNTYKYCCKTGCLITNDCELIETKEDNEAKKTEAYNLLQAAKAKVNAKKIEEKLQSDIAEEQIKVDAKKQEAEKARKEADKKLAAAKSAKELAEKKAKEKALADAKTKKEGALAAALKRVADAEQAIKNNIATKKKAFQDKKNKEKEEKLAEAQGLANEKRLAANNLAERLKAKELEIEQKEKEAEEQLKQKELQEEEALLVAQKQQELLNSTDAINKNHKVARGLDIATATVSAVSSVASGVSMGFSIATIETVKKALSQLKECKADIYQIKILNGKYIALVNDGG